MPQQEENLDDVIASLIDVDEEPSESNGKQEAGADDISENPVTLSARAARQVQKIKQQEKLEDDLYLRIAVEGGGCSGLSYKLGLDIKTDEDQLFESEGVQIVVKKKHLMYLDGILIDYPDGLDARGFTFENPNASESCGCGTSFAV